MKFNEQELVQISEEKSEMEGAMNYKKINITSQYNQSVFKERWFKLVDNLLFYFRINSARKVSEKQVVGVFVLENALIVENMQECAFGFSITYIDEPDKKHIFSCISEKAVSLWINKLKHASYEYLRTQLYILQSKIYSITGKDPLLMIPRNEGSMKWAPGDPLPVQVVPEDHLQSNGVGFRSHINVHRSQSSSTVFHRPSVSNGNSELERSWPGSSSVEKSKTTANMFNAFDDLKLGRMYHRPAPSPPPRKKNSPQLPRNIIKLDESIFSNDNLSQPPLPPQRRNSPKLGIPKTDIRTENRELANDTDEFDLIKF